MAQLKKRPNLAAALLFLALALIFMNRALFPAEGQVLGGYDMRGYYYIMPQVIKEALAGGHLPLWDPFRYNGFPLLADPQVNTFYPVAWLMLILPVNVGISWYMVVHIWLAGMGMYGFVRFMGQGTSNKLQVGKEVELSIVNSQLSIINFPSVFWLPAVLSGISFAFSGFLAGRLWAGHSTVYAVVAWIPWMLWGLAWSVKRGDWQSAVLAGIPFGMSILAGHVASFLYVGLIWAAFALYLFLTPLTIDHSQLTIDHSPSRLLVIRQSLFILLIGLGLSAIQLAPFVQFSLTSARVAEADYEFATDYSFPPAHLITLLLPEFFGEPTRIGYWSVPVFEELTYYAGLLSFLGLILALRKPTKLTWFYIGLMGFGLWLALGRYGGLYKLFYDLFPPFRVIRAPGRAAYLYLTAVTALLGHTLSRWRAEGESNQWSVLSAQSAVAPPPSPLAPPPSLLPLHSLLRWTLIMVGICGFTALAATGAVFMAIHPTETSGRLWHQVGGYSIALVILLLGGGLIWRWLTTPADQTRQRTLLAVALVVLCTADMWLFAWKTVRLEPGTTDPFWLDAKAVIGETQDRIVPWGISLFSQNEPLSVGLRTVFGYDALEPAAHMALATSVPDPRSSAFDVLGVRYVVSNVGLDEFVTGERPLSLVAQQGLAYVYERARVMPVARLVYQVEIISDEAAMITRIHQPDFDPTTTAVLAQHPPCELNAAAGGVAEILSASPGYWHIRTSSPVPALLVLAENAYPGWRVTVDDETAEPLTAYTTLKAVCIPAGEHLVEWQFAPPVLWVGLGITLVSLAVVAFATLGAIVRSKQ